MTIYYYLKKKTKTNIFFIEDLKFKLDSLFISILCDNLLLFKKNVKHILYIGDLLK